jgi:small subunit ribosomal protein S16
MALRIRLARFGSKQNPHYRVVVAQSTSARDGKAVDTIGHYHPSQKENRVSIDGDLFRKWVKNGAIPSETVTRLALDCSIEEASKFKKIHNSPFVGKSKKERKESKK